MENSKNLKPDFNEDWIFQELQSITNLDSIPEQNASDEVAPKVIQSKQSEVKKIYTPSNGEVMGSILSVLVPVDFKPEAGLDKKESLYPKHIQFVVVKHLVDLAIKKAYGIVHWGSMGYIYNGAYWCSVSRVDIEHFLSKAASRLGERECDALHFEFADKLYKQFKSFAGRSKPKQDNRNIRLNLQNGTAEFTSKGFQLRDFDREDYLTYQLPFSYDPSAKAPNFTKFLSECVPDQSLQDILMEYIAYVFIPHSQLKLEKVLLIYGSGANGKSVFFEVINALLGRENISSFSMESLTDKDS